MNRLIKTFWAIFMILSVIYLGWILFYWLYVIFKEPTNVLIELLGI